MQCCEAATDGTFRITGLLPGLYVVGASHPGYEDALIRNVLVDTGFMQDEHSSGFSRKFGIPNWISPLRMLAALEVAPETITDIFVSHAHFDHMGSISQ